MDQCVSFASCEKNKEACYNTKIKPIMDELKDVKESMNDIKVEIASLPERLIEKLDARYAGKETEENLKWLTRLVVGAVVLAVLGLVIKSQ